MHNSSSTIAALALCVWLSASARAQEPPPAHDHQSAPVPSTWAWMTDANAFFGYNYQQRHFADFSSWESQNWFMVSGERAAGAGRLTVEGMFSLERFTLHPQG